MKKTFLFIRLIAGLTALIFSSEQIILANGSLPSSVYTISSKSPTVDSTQELSATFNSQINDATTDFFVTQNSPLSMSDTPQNVYGENGELRTESLINSKTIHHVYQGESIQNAIEGAKAGDTIFIHVGIYKENLELKNGVSIKGEDANATILNGENKTGTQIIRALGNNRIEDITVTGGGAYSGTPSSAIKVDGDKVQIRNSIFSDNKDYGIFAAFDGHLLIEGNIFINTHIGVQLPKDKTQIRYNTFYECDIGVNVLNGTTPEIANNIFYGSKNSSIYEFNWASYAKGEASRGFLTAINNTFWANKEKPSAYGSAMPFMVEQQAEGNIKENPQFFDASNGDFRNLERERGAILPEALKRALTRASLFSYEVKIENILDEGAVTGYKTLYNDGSIEKFYNDGRDILDTTPPEINIADEIWTNQTSGEITYEVDGVLRTLAFEFFGETASITIEETDILGNKAAKTILLKQDLILPTGTLQIENFVGKANTREAVITVNAQDNAALKDLRFSADGGITWTEWTSCGVKKGLDINIDTTEILCQLRDRAGNITTLSANILKGDFASTINFISSNITNDENYILRYTIDGELHEEHWKLNSGENRLIVSIAQGGLAEYADFVVTLNAPSDSFKDIPQPLGTIPNDLISYTAEDGSLVSYSQGKLFSIEMTGDYCFYSPEFDDDGELVNGIVEFANGSRICYENGNVIRRIDSDGAKSIYDGDNHIVKKISENGEEVSFAYRFDEAENVSGILSTSNGASNFYDENGEAVWIKRADNSEWFYQNGRPYIYQDSFGNKYKYETAVSRDGMDITGFKTSLTYVLPSGQETWILYSDVAASYDEFAEIKNVFNAGLPKEITYESGGEVKEIVSTSGALVNLENGMLTGVDAGGNQTYTFDVDRLGNNENYFVVTQDGGDFSQKFNERGELIEIQMAGGESLKIKELKLDQIIFENGEFLSDLTRDENNLIGFVYNHLDGSRDFYQDGKIIKREDADGVITRYVSDAAAAFPESVLLPDGREYILSETINLNGEIERLMTLASVSLAGGEQLQFQNGNAAWLSAVKIISLNPQDIPSLLDNQFFVPSIKLTKAELKNLTVDENGDIFSGEILFSDGTQFFIEEGKIIKQATADGHLIELENTALENTQQQKEILAEPLTAKELEFRNQIIDAQLDYFTDGIGIDAATGLPVDSFAISAGEQSTYSQSTLVGFWAEILAAIARGDFPTQKLSQDEAFSKLNQLLQTYKEAQRDAGWKGILSFFSRGTATKEILDEETNEPTGEIITTYYWKNEFDQAGLGDALNLAMSLASVIGAFGNFDVAPEFNNQKDQILSTAREILLAQEEGFSAFYDAENDRFYGSVKLNQATGKWEFENYVMDRVFNEFRSGLIYLATKYPQYASSVKKLEVARSEYELQNGEKINIALTYDGGAFQMFWPLIHVDETKYPQFDVAIKNFLYAQADFAAHENIAGLLSAGANALSEYESKSGVQNTAETDERLFSDAGSLYGTAAAFGAAPHYTLQFLKNLIEQFPEIMTSAGFVDSIGFKTVLNEDEQTGEIFETTETVFSDSFFGVNQAAFLLSLLKIGQTYFSNYLKNEGLETEFDTLYQSFKWDLSPVTESNSTPPFGTEPADLLYQGDSEFPDGKLSGLVKQPSFIASIQDTDLGKGKVYNYLTNDGSFHHSEIEFGSDKNILKMNLQEYFLSPSHSGVATSILDGIDLNILDSSIQKGVFYTPGNGAAGLVVANDSKIGAVTRMPFDFKNVEYPVGIWANFNERDFSGYDFFSVPVRVDSANAGKVRLKFEFKGMGEIFISDFLDTDWNYLSLPIPKSFSNLSQLAISIQTLDGEAASGDVLLGPISAIKIRTSNDINWQVLLGKTESEIKNLVLRALVENKEPETQIEARDILRNFSLDDNGRVVNGILELATGDKQYFQNGRLVKWIFADGKTILFENGLASFILDLSRGKLETGRFYYERNFKGDIQSFVLRDNDSERVFSLSGEMVSYFREGVRAFYENGEMKFIKTSTAELNDLEFSSEGELLSARVTLSDGREFDLDKEGVQTLYLDNGATVFVKDGRTIAIETPQNGRINLTYRLDALGRMFGVDVSFFETVQGEEILREMDLFDYLNLAGREIERNIIFDEAVCVLDSAIAGGFSVGQLKQGEITTAVKNSSSNEVAYTYRYAEASGTTLGAVVKPTRENTRFEDYDFFTLNVRENPNFLGADNFYLKLKTTNMQTRFSGDIQGVSVDEKLFGFSLQGITGDFGEMTLEVIRDENFIGQTQGVYLNDIKFLNLRKFDEILEMQIGADAEIFQRLKTKGDKLVFIGEKIAAYSPFVLDGAVEFLNMPTQMTYKGTKADLGRVEAFERFDGSRVELNEQNEVSRVILSDGSVHEFEVSGNFTVGHISGIDQAAGTTNELSYRYGMLKKIISADGREINLSYEYDSDGKKITVFTDAASGEEQKFKDGKIISTDASTDLKTQYEYVNGVLSGARLTYNGRTLSETQYEFAGDETRITDEEGTIWFYDAAGELTKHITTGGFLYEYSGHTQEAEDGGEISDDYKKELYESENLREVRLNGYEAKDGSWIKYDFSNGAEIRLASGIQAFNVEFDSEQKMKSGQLLFPDEMILEIENYVPVRGRLPSGEIFDCEIPLGESYELIQDEKGNYDGFSIAQDGIKWTYNAFGELIKTESEDGETNTFTYVRNASGEITDVIRKERKQADFNGVPFPKEIILETTGGQRLFDTGELAASHDGDGFLAAIYKEATNQWEVYTGTFNSEANRAGLNYFLSSIKTGEYFVMAVSDPNFYKADEETKSLLEGLGAGNVREIASQNMSWSFIGNESLSIGEGIESVKKLSSTYETTVTEKIITSQKFLFYKKTTYKYVTYTKQVPAEFLEADELSTITESIHEELIDVEAKSSWEGGQMFLNMLSAVHRAYSDFLIQSESLKIASDLQILVVYNEKNEMVFSRRMDGISSFYENGNVRETFSAEGELLSVHEYEQNSDGEWIVSKITLVKVRQDFEEESARLLNQIEQAKYDALLQLVWQDDVARLEINENVTAGLAAYDAHIAYLNSQLFRTVKQCKKIVFVTHCEKHTYEVPGVREMIYTAQNERRNLLVTGEEELAKIPGAIADKKIEIEQATLEKITELETQKQEFLLDILRKEMEPVITDIYRRVLGRDVSKEEFEEWILRYKETGAVNVEEVYQTLNDSDEKIVKQNQKNMIIRSVRDFLEDYLEADAAERETLLEELNLTKDETVALDSEEVDLILGWLNTRDLHFGQSAFLSLQEMLASEGVETSLETLGIQTILIDILTGVIHRFSAGELVISMFALERTAQIYAKQFAVVRYDFQDLLDLYKEACPDQETECGFRVIAHIAGDHFVVIKRVTETEVVMVETNKGEDGEVSIARRDEFMKRWLDGEGSGHLLVSDSKAVQTKKLTNEQSRKIRGAFFPLIIVWAFWASVALSVASVIVAPFSPTFGKILGYAALVASVISIVASVGNFIVQGVKSIFTQIAANGIISTLKAGISQIGGIIVSGVKAVGRFFSNAWTFTKDAFTGGLKALGSGLMKIKNYAAANVGGLATKEGLLKAISNNLVLASINWNVSNGLEILGLDSRLTRIISSAVGAAYGGAMGVGLSVNTTQEAMAEFWKSGISAFALQGVNEISRHLDLPPPLLSIVETVGSVTLEFFNTELTLDEGFKKILPDVVNGATAWGIDFLGESLELDSRITKLLGLSVTSLAGGLVADYLNPKRDISFDLDSIWERVKDAFLSKESLGGTLSISAEVVIDKFELDESLWKSGVARIVAGMFNDFLSDTPAKFDFIKSIGKSVDESIDDFLNKDNLVNLLEAIDKLGFSEGIEKYATFLFTQGALQEMTKGGETIAYLIEHGIFRNASFWIDGKLKNVLMVEANGKTVMITYEAHGDKKTITGIYEENEDGSYQYVSWEVDENGEITNIKVIKKDSSGGIKTEEDLKTGNFKITFEDFNGNEYGEIFYDKESGKIGFSNQDAGITSSLNAGGKIEIDFAILPDMEDIKGFLENYNQNMTKDSAAQIVAFSVGQGFWNSLGSYDQVSDLMSHFRQAVKEDKIKFGAAGIVLFDENGNIAYDKNGEVLTTAALPVTLYEETTLFGNSIRWIAETFFGYDAMSDEVKRECQRYLDLIKLNQENYGLTNDIELVHFSHSGNFMPMIKALENMEEKYQKQITALVVYEGPYVGDGIIDDPYLETLIRIRGNKDGVDVPFIDHKIFSKTDEYGNIVAIENQYQIEILGAGHNDYSYQGANAYATESERQIAENTSLFIRDLNLAVENKTVVDFLAQVTTGIVVKNDVVYVNPLEYVSANAR